MSHYNAAVEEMNDEALVFKKVLPAMHTAAKVGIIRRPRGVNKASCGLSIRLTPANSTDNSASVKSNAEQHVC